MVIAFSGCFKEAKKEARLTRAERNFEGGRYDKAKIDYMAVLRQEPENALAIKRVGFIWSEEGGVLPALPYLLKTRELDPGDIVNRKKAAGAFGSIGEWGRAKERIALDLAAGAR